MKNFNVNVTDVMVTEWNEEFQDWSGREFYKEGFYIGNAKSNKLDDVLTEINTMFTIEKESVEIDEDGFLRFAVIENGEAMQDDNGHYLVDYTIGIEKVETVNIEE